MALTKIEVITRLESLEAVRDKLLEIGVTSFSAYEIMGYGAEIGQEEVYRGFVKQETSIPRIKIDIIISTIPKDKVVNTLTDLLNTGEKGDGKIFISAIQEVVHIRTGLKDIEALNYED